MSNLVEVKTPELSESIQSGSLLEWRVGVGEKVERDQILVDLETDKVVLEVPAPAAGVMVEIRMPSGAEVKAGDILALIDSAAEVALPSDAAADAVDVGVNLQVAAPPASAPASTSASTSVSALFPQGSQVEPARSASSEKPAVSRIDPPFLPPRLRGRATHEQAQVQEQEQDRDPLPLTADAKDQRVASPDHVSYEKICPPCSDSTADGKERMERHVPMSRLRLRIAERLKEAQNTAAMLTTFNEVNMQPVMTLRQRYQDRFVQEHGVKLGFTSFFTKAVCQALKEFPAINARLEGRDIVYHDFYDIGVAVSSERGLVVPVLRNADSLSFAQIEQSVADFAKRANALQLKLEEMEGGTFTISNGGVFGSLLSTPILNPPQSGVLGLHKIEDRPIAENGQVVIRPMMYMALTYDHRMVDGREAVSFLRMLKESLEDPARLLLDV